MRLLNFTDDFLLEVPSQQQDGVRSDPESLLARNNWDVGSRGQPSRFQRIIIRNISTTDSKTNSTALQAPDQIAQPDPKTRPASHSVG
jgi:hypothetical protein